MKTKLAFLFFTFFATTFVYPLDFTRPLKEKELHISIPDHFQTSFDAEDEKLMMQQYEVRADFADGWSEFIGLIVIKKENELLKQIEEFKQIVLSVSPEAMTNDIQMDGESAYFDLDKPAFDYINFRRIVGVNEHIYVKVIQGDDELIMVSYTFRYPNTDSHEMIEEKLKTFLDQVRIR